MHEQTSPPYQFDHFSFSLNSAFSSLLRILWTSKTRKAKSVPYLEWWSLLRGDMRGLSMWDSSCLLPLSPQLFFRVTDDRAKQSELHLVGMWSVTTANITLRSFPNKILNDVFDDAHVKEVGIFKTLLDVSDWNRKLQYYFSVSFS